MANIKKYEVKEPYLSLNCSLGEAPLWEKSRDSLRFVDIVKRKVHTVNLSEGPSSHKEFDLDFSIATTADIEGNDDEFIFGGKYVHRFAQLMACRRLSIIQVGLRHHAPQDRQGALDQADVDRR